MSNIVKYRAVLSVFMLGLVVSGITAFPLAWEMRLLTTLFGIDPSLPPERYGGLAFWLATVNHGLHETYAAYPWVAYGTDWLAFAHIVIAVYFIGPLIDPLRNEWVLHAGLIGCALVLPLALICGPLRGIPLYWRLIDCSFGLLGAVPLLYCMHMTRLMRMITPNQDTRTPA
jgi:succinate-acetate transporter protein